MGIVFITAGILCVMYALTFVSYINESKILDDIKVDNILDVK